MPQPIRLPGLRVGSLVDSFVHANTPGALRAAITSLLSLILVLVFVSPATAQKIWSGLGDGTSWSDAANWVGGSAPVPADPVLLDNAMVPGSYSVILPAGAVTTSIVRLTIAPAGGQSITLMLPATNTAVPGLQVGDATPATDDITLMAGALLMNASGAASGNGIEVNTTANGTIRIENGARYLHKTARSTAGVVPVLSTAAGTENGVFEYDSPGTGSVPIGASGRTYGTLKLTRTAGTGTYTSAGASPLTVRGDFIVGPGVTYTSSMSGNMNLLGDWTCDGVAATLGANQFIVFNPEPQCIVSGSGLTTWNGGGSVAATKTVSIVAGTAVALGGTLTNDGTLSVAGTLELRDGGSVASLFPDWPSMGILSLNTTNAPYALGVSDGAWPVAGGPHHVVVRGMGLALNAPRGVDDLRVIAPVTGAANLTVGVSCTMETGGSLDAGPSYGPGSTLVYDSGDFLVGPEWGAGTSVGPGVPGNATIQAGNGHVVTMPAGDRYLPGKLTVSSGTLAANGDIHLGDDLVDDTLNGILWAGHTLVLDGNLGADHVFSIIVGDSISLDGLTLIDAQVTLDSFFDFFVEIAPTNGGECLRMQGNSDLYVNGGVLRLGALGMPGCIIAVADGDRTLHGPGTVVYRSAMQVVDAGSAGRMVDDTLDGILRAPVDFGGSLTTLRGGSLVMEAGGSLTNITPTLTEDELILKYHDGNFAVGYEWGPGTSVGSGVPEHVVIDAGVGNTVTMPAADRTVPGNLTVLSGSIIYNGHAGLGANLVNGDPNGIVWNGNPLTLIGSGDRIIQTAGPVDQLVVQTTGGALTTLQADLTIAQSLELAGGDIATGAHALVMAPGASVTRTSGSVRGNLQKHVDPPAAPVGPAMLGTPALTLTFEVGSASGYTPVDLTYDAVAAAGEVTVSTTPAEHPDAAASGVDVAQDVNRYWTLSLNRAPDPSESFSATFHWLAGDQDPGSDSQLFDVYGKSGTWTRTVAGARTASSTTASGLTEYGDYIVGTPGNPTAVAPPALATFFRSVGPNPFAGSTAFAVGLERAGRVTLVIYDVAGRRVCTLLEASRGAGPGVVAWDGRDDAGRRVASGRYLARMEAEGRAFTVGVIALR